MKTHTPWQRFILLLKPDKKEIRNVYIYSIFNGLLILSLPLGIQAIINIIQGGEINATWFVLVLFVVIGVFLTGLFQIFQLRITENLQQKIFARAAFEFAYRIPKIKMEELYKHYAPELMNRFFDVVSVQKGLAKILIDFTTAVLHIIFGLVLLSFYHPFFIAFSIVLVVLVYAMFRFTVKRGLKTSLDESEEKYKVANWLEELARTGTTFKLAGKTSLPLEKTDQFVNGYINARESHFKILQGQYGLLLVFKVLVAAGLLIMGSVLVMEQFMNIGQFVAAEIIILLIISAVEKLVMSLDSIYDILTSLEKIGQVTDLELEPESGMNLNKDDVNKGLSIQLKKVEFGYPGKSTPIFTDLKFNIGSGEKWFITADNGAGTSTLLNLLGGLYNPNSGSISYDNLPKGNINPESLRSVIGDYLTHEKIFNGTVLENITMGRTAATFENVQWAVDKLGLQSFIESLSDGYDTELETNSRLSASITAKMLLARSIVDKPRLLLVEDGFVHLHVKERQRIIDFLTSKENHWTLVAISNSDYLANKCDRVAVLKDGKIHSYDSFKKLNDVHNLKSVNHA
jgi:ABC-type bacteriocin/lantibiotic exporter with double-glycine peptidase domain